MTSVGRIIDLDLAKTQDVFFESIVWGTLRLKRNLCFRIYNPDFSDVEFSFYKFECKNGIFLLYPFEGTLLCKRLVLS